MKTISVSCRPHLEFSVESEPEETARDKVFRKLKRALDNRDMDEGSRVTFPLGKFDHILDMERRLLSVV